MYSIKFIPYPYSAEQNEKSIHMLSADEYKWTVKYPQDAKALREILDKYKGFIVIWELPLDEKFPKDGIIQLVLLTTYRNTNPEGCNRLTVDTYIAYDCSVFIMNDNGKTIDRIG